MPIHAKLKYTTLIEVPATEKIMEAATGDKEFWVVDVVGNFCFVHPAKAGIASNLNLITDKGNIYSFTLQDVSDTSAAPDLEGPGPACRSVGAGRFFRPGAVRQIVTELDVHHLPLICRSPRGRCGFVPWR